MDEVTPTSSSFSSVWYVKPVFFNTGGFNKSKAIDQRALKPQTKIQANGQSWVIQPFLSKISGSIWRWARTILFYRAKIK